METPKKNLSVRIPIYSSQMLFHLHLLKNTLSFVGKMGHNGTSYDAHLMEIYTLARPKLYVNVSMRNAPEKP